MSSRAASEGWALGPAAAPGIRFISILCDFGILKRPLAGRRGTAIFMPAAATTWKA
jgi:hypothetical protein